MGGHYFGQPYTLPHLLIYQTVANPLSLMWYVIAFSFLQICSSCLHLDWGPLMYSYVLLGKSHKLWTYRLIFFIFAIITSSPYLLRSIIFTVSSQSQLLPLVVTFHIFFTWNDDFSYTNAQRAVISLPSSHHLALIQRFQFERLSPRMGFMYSSVI